MKPAIQFTVVLLTALLCLGDASIAADAPTSLSGDIDCDGRTDAISYVVKANAVVVEVKFGQLKRPAESLTFSVGAAAQDSVCSPPKRLSLESLDFDPKADGIGDLAGFRRSKTCKGIVLDDEQCDPIHVYWDHDSHHLSWWRN